MNKEESNYYGTNVPMMSLVYKYHTLVNEYRRKVFNIMELTGIIGGLFELFEIIVGLVIGIFTSYFFKRELRKEITKANDQYSQIRAQFEELKGQVESQNNQIKQDHDRNISVNEGGESQESLEEIKSPSPSVRRKKHRRKKLRPRDLRPVSMIHNRGFPNSSNASNISSASRNIEEVKKPVNDIEDSFSFSRNESHYFKVKPVPMSLQDFQNTLDGVDISFSIATLKEQVAYLLSQDSLYSELKEGKKPNLNQMSPNEEAKINLVKVQPYTLVDNSLRIDIKRDVIKRYTKTMPT